jgi:hypothetical protein
MSLDDEYSNGISFDKVCPSCGVGNPDDADNCIICDKDLNETVIFLEDEFYDIELTKTSLIEYRKNFFRTRRTGKVKRYRLNKMEKIVFGYPVTRLNFYYNGKKEVYALKEENYRSLKDVMIKIGIIKD